MKKLTQTLCICGSVVAFSIIAHAQSPDLKYNQYGEVVLDGGNPTTEPTKAIDGLASAIQKDKKANRFRITWSYDSKDRWGSGSALYIRDERVLKYYFWATRVKVGDKPATQQTENLLFTKITDDILIKLAQACKSKGFLELYLADEPTRTRETVYPARPTVFSWMDRFASGGRYELKERQ